MQTCALRRAPRLLIVWALLALGGNVTEGSIRPLSKYGDMGTKVAPPTTQVVAHLMDRQNASPLSDRGVVFASIRGELILATERHPDNLDLFWVLYDPYTAFRRNDLGGIYARIVFPARPLAVITYNDIGHIVGEFCFKPQMKDDLVIIIIVLHVPFSYFEGIRGIERPAIHIDPSLKVVDVKTICRDLRGCPNAGTVQKGETIMFIWVCVYLMIPQKFAKKQ